MDDRKKLKNDMETKPLHDEEIVKSRRDVDVDEIYLTSCAIETVPDMKQYKNLKRLYLNRNNMFQLGPGLQQNYILTELYLQNNMLTSINSVLQHLTCLRVLLLHHNQLTVLTDVIYEMRHMMNLKVLNMSNSRKSEMKRFVQQEGSTQLSDLFANPLAQDLNYRGYVIYCMRSIELFDRKAVTQDERDKVSKKYDLHKKKMKDTIAFGRRVDGPPQRIEQLDHHLNAYREKDDIVKAEDVTHESHEDIPIRSTSENKFAAAVEKRAKVRSIMQFKTFSWIDILNDREDFCEKRAGYDPIILSAKFR